MTNRYYINPNQAILLKNKIVELYPTEFVTHEDALFNIYLDTGQSVVISERTGLVTVYEETYN